MNALVIAPRVDLPWAESEAQHVHNLLDGKIVTGSVSVRDILDVMGSDSFDILWFATHGDDDGIALSDNKWLTPDVLAQMARRCQCRLVFLNACATEQVAADIFKSVQVRIVCTVGAVHDTTAYFTGRVFAEYLSGGSSIEEAYRNSKTASFRMIPEDSRRLNGHLESQVYTNRDDIYELRRDMRDVMEDMARIKAYNRAEFLERSRTRTTMYFILGILLLALALLIRNTVLLNQLTNAL